MRSIFSSENSLTVAIAGGVVCGPVDNSPRGVGVASKTGQIAVINSP